jgi:hypothetical protein
VLSRSEKRHERPASNASAHTGENNHPPKPRWKSKRIVIAKYIWLNLCVRIWHWVPPGSSNNGQATVGKVSLKCHRVNTQDAREMNENETLPTRTGLVKLLPSIGTLNCHRLSTFLSASLSGVGTPEDAKPEES